MVSWKKSTSYPLKYWPLFFFSLSSSFFNPLPFCHIGFFTGGLGLLWGHTLHTSACLGQYPSLIHFSASPRRDCCVGLLRLRSTTEAMKGSITHFHRLGNLNGSIINSYKLQFSGQISRVKRNKTALLEREKKDKVVKKNWRKQSAVKDHESPCLFILSKNIDPCNILLIWNTDIPRIIIMAIISPSQSQAVHCETRRDPKSQGRCALFRDGDRSLYSSSDSSTTVSYSQTTPIPADFMAADIYWAPSLCEPWLVLSALFFSIAISFCFAGMAHCWNKTAIAHPLKTFSDQWLALENKTC